MRACLPALLCTLALATGAGAALAETVTVKDGRFDAEVSAKQMSMISLVGEKVTSIRKMDDPKGPQILMEADGNTGGVFVGFDGDVLGRSFSAFLVTESGKTVEAVLTPRDIAAETVTVRLPATDAIDHPAADATGEASSAPPPVVASAPRHESYSELLTALIRLMFNDDAPSGVIRRTTSEPVRRAGPFDMQAIATFQVAGLKGTVLSLKNTSSAGQPVSAKTFLVSGVLAASVSHETIDPGQFGRVYIVEEDR
jgi:hypothetical protein